MIQKDNRSQEQNQDKKINVYDVLEKISKGAKKVKPLLLIGSLYFVKSVLDTRIGNYKKK
ncbi:hypothetical protein [Butyrivibrio fibrisolvens]|uniref:hypothetical protein n=1 Tax=Butyrivibrio fibrisolvens TaxID=831 RepID=UPI0004820B58|nr:hypothetical protein [Butyrivibrio fibrisolvens]